MVNIEETQSNEQNNTPRLKLERFIVKGGFIQKRRWRIGTALMVSACC